MAARLAASRRFPPSSSTCTSQRMAHTFSAALMQRDSASMALLSRRPRSRTFPSSAAYSLGLGDRDEERKVEGSEYGRDRNCRGGREEAGAVPACFKCRRSHRREL
jgi:hypothetical protein